MFLDRKPFLYLWGPVYRLVFQSFLWPVLGRVGSVLTAGAQQRLAALEMSMTRLEGRIIQTQAGPLAVERVEPAPIEAHPSALQRAIGQYGAAVERLGAEDCQTAAALRAQMDVLSLQLTELSARDAAQWAALEQLVLAILGNARDSFATGGK